MSEKFDATRSAKALANGVPKGSRTQALGPAIPVLRLGTRNLFRRLPGGYSPSDTDSFGSTPLGHARISKWNALQILQQIGFNVL